MTHYTLHVYSGADEQTGSMGYDGSFGVVAESIVDVREMLPAVLDTMDSIYGPCFVTVEWQAPYGGHKYHNAFACERK